MLPSRRGQKHRFGGALSRHLWSSPDYRGRRNSVVGGDVYIANSVGDEVSEFAHGGTTPIASWVDNKDRRPQTCSVDPTTGDLAATEYGGGGTSNSLAIFSSPSARPMDYTTVLAVYSHCAYDAQGNLFVDGVNGRRKFRLLELPKGANKFQSIVLDKVINMPATSNGTART
jgi:hypothetical protein